MVQPGATTAEPSVGRARAGVAALFFTNGALFATLVPRYPEIKTGLDLSNAAFGSAFAAYGLGSLGVGLVAGVLVARYGSARVARVVALALAVAVVAVGAAPSWLALAAALLVVGALDAVGDLAVNAHGLRVERRLGRSVLNSLHALWSIGAVTGGAVGAGAAGLGVPLVVHAGAAGAVLGAVALAASRWLLPGQDAVDRPPVEGPGGRRGSARHLRVGGRLLALGVVAAAAQVVEDTGATWGALYLRGELGAGAAVGGLGFVALQGLQTAGRFLGDPLVTRFGDRAVARVGAALTAAAMATALAVPTVAGTVVAFGLAGLGIGTLIPGGMRAADAVPGLPAGFGLTFVGTVLRVALLLSPVTFGLVADATSVGTGMLVIPAAAVVALLLATALPPRPARTVRP